MKKLLRFAVVGIKKERARNFGKEGGVANELDSCFGEFNRVRYRKNKKKMCSFNFLARFIFYIWRTPHQIIYLIVGSSNAAEPAELKHTPNPPNGFVFRTNFVFLIYLSSNT